MSENAYRGLHLRLLNGLGWGLSRLGQCTIWLIYTKDLTQPLLPCAARCAIDLGLATVDDLREVAAMVEHQDPQQIPGRLRIFRQRVAGGSFCFVARADGAIVASNWIRIATAVGAEGVDMVFEDDEIYTTDAYTAPAWRGFGIHTVLNHAMLEFAQGRGFKTAYTMVRITNTASWVTMARVGWQHAGSLLIFRPAWAPQREIWRASGSVYPMPVRRDHGRPRKVLPDLREFDQYTLISDRPWSKTYRMEKDDQVWFLKIIAQERASILRASEILANSYPADVPAVTACDHEHMGWIMMRDHHGEALDVGAGRSKRLTMIAAIASLQVRSASDQRLQASLPSIDVSRVWPRFLSFVGDGGLGPDERGRVGAAYFLGADETAAVVVELTRHQAALQVYLEAAARLPRALEHGNLDPSNGVIVADGHCVLCNWTAACWGPVGLSLFPLIVDGLPTRLPAEDDGDASAKGAVDVALLDSYLRTLSRQGFADAMLLREGLPASVAIGLMRYLISFADYPTDDPAHLVLMRRELRGGLRMLLALGARLEFAT